jgi:hypothetical protein
MKKIIYIKYYIYNYGRMGGFAGFCMRLRQTRQAFRRVQMGGLGVGMGGLVGAEMGSSIVMYNFGVGPRGDPLFTAF